MKSGNAWNIIYCELGKNKDFFSFTSWSIYGGIQAVSTMKDVTSLPSIFPKGGRLFGVHSQVKNCKNTYTQKVTDH